MKAMEFDTNQALGRWMEDEGLSPFTLLKVSPKPTAAGKKVPATVTMEWGIQDLEDDGARQRFFAWQLTAEAVEVFRCQGKLDHTEQCSAEFGEGGGIDVLLESGATLILRCARIHVTDKPVVRFRKRQPRPHHGEATLQLELSNSTWVAIRSWLGIPADLISLRHLTLEPVDTHMQPKDAAHVTIVDEAKHDVVWLGVSGNRLHVARGKWATDELWMHIWSRLASVPGVTQISSRDLVCAPGVWPVQPPPKPTPQVWPNVYGVTCEFTEITLEDLRICLRLPSSSRFVIHPNDTTEQPPEYTLGQLARRAAPAPLRLVVQNDGGEVLLQCNVNLRESALSFQRERACDNATWLAVWRAPERLPGVRARHSRTTRSPPDPWPVEPPVR
jgi:hypothetical protein